MNAQTLLQLFLVLHITGFTMMAGSVIADYSINRRLNRYLITDKQKALIILDGSAGLAALIGIGAGLLISTGLGMVAIFKGAVTTTLWFKIKMILVLLVLLNGIGMARPGVILLKKTLAEHTADSNTRILRLKTRLRNIYVSQLILFIIIFILSIFKPS